jgi:hypothetical protein
MKGFELIAAVVEYDAPVGEYPVDVEEEEPDFFCDDEQFFP